MFNRNALLALIAAAAVGLAFTPDMSSAKGFGGHGGGGHGGGHSGSGHSGSGHSGGHGGGGQRGGHFSHGPNTRIGHGPNTKIGHGPNTKIGHRPGRGPNTKIGRHFPKFEHHHFPQHHFVRWHGYGHGTPSYAYGSSYSGSGYVAPASYDAPEQTAYVAPAPAAYSAPAPAPASSSCTCLTKRYENGAVIFEDTCTHEGAMSDPDDQQDDQAQAQQPQQ